MAYALFQTLPGPLVGQTATNSNRRQVAVTLAKTTIRHTVASMNTATASVKPSIWTTRKLPIVNA